MAALCFAAENDELILACHGQPPNQEGVGDSEDGGREADAERERECCRDREAR